MWVLSRQWCTNYSVLFIKDSDVLLKHCGYESLGTWPPLYTAEVVYEDIKITTSDRKILDVVNKHKQRKAIIDKISKSRGSEAHGWIATICLQEHATTHYIKKACTTGLPGLKDKPIKTYSCIKKHTHKKYDTVVQYSMFWPQPEVLLQLLWMTDKFKFGVPTIPHCHGNDQLYLLKYIICTL